MSDLVVMSLEGWDEVWRRNQYLVAGLLASDPELRVLFVEPPDDPAHDVRSGRRPRIGHAVRAVQDRPRLHTYRPTKWLPRRLDAGTDDRLARRVRRAAMSLGMTAPVLWINDPGAAAVARRTGWPVVYDITDDWLAADRPADALRRLAADEAWLLTHAQAVIACSAEIVRRKSSQRPASAPPLQLIPNAVDVAAYRVPAARPADLPAGRCAVYVGTLHPDRLDVDLCAQTALRAAGSAVVVLVGPNVLSDADTARLKESGVVLLGARSRDEVIGYLQYADVLIVPHVVTAFTDSLDPIKLYEYQAVGRPVVSTRVAGFRDAADDRIVIADVTDFPDAVARFIESARPLVAGTDRGVADWSVRVTAVRAVLGEVRKH